MYTSCVRLFYAITWGQGETDVPKSALPKEFLQIIVNVKQVWRPQYEAVIYDVENDDQNTRIKGNSLLILCLFVLFFSLLIGIKISKGSLLLPYLFSLATEQNWNCFFNNIQPICQNTALFVLWTKQKQPTATGKCIPSLGILSIHRFTCTFPNWGGGALPEGTRSRFSAILISVDAKQDFPAAVLQFCLVHWNSWKEAVGKQTEHTSTTVNSNQGTHISFFLFF